MRLVQSTRKRLEYFSLGENGEITFIDLFKEILACQIDAHETFLLPSEFVDQPVNCLYSASNLFVFCFILTLLHTIRH